MTHDATRSDLVMHEDRASSLLHVAELLWRAPYTVCLGRPSSRQWAAQSYLVLPGAADPRRLIPLESRRASAAAVLHGARDEALGNRLRAAALAGALRCGLAQRLLRDRFTVRAAHPGEEQEDSIREHLGAVFGEPVALSLRLGPPRANLKPVIEVLGRRGHCLGYAKIGINELTSRLVQHEATVLAELAATHPLTTQVPEVLHVGEWRGLAVLVLSPLPLGAASRQPPASMVSRSMLEVAGSTGSASIVLRNSAFARRLAANAEAAAAEGWDHAAREVRRTLEELAEHDLAFGRWHGDWHPGNMAAGSDGRLLLWDWERSSPDVPTGLDALHLQVQAGVLARRPPSESVGALRTKATGLLAPFGVHEGQADDVVRLYLAEILLRYVHDRQWTMPWARALMDEMVGCLSAWKPL